MRTDPPVSDKQTPAGPARRDHTGIDPKAGAWILKGRDIRARDDQILLGSAIPL
jgi:hypothetical protein